MTPGPLPPEAPCPALGAAYADPVPVAGQLLSTDAVEGERGPGVPEGPGERGAGPGVTEGPAALSAHSPAALALHELLRQQLNLTRGFVDASRRLHAALLRGLDAEDWRYHSLEEAREVRAEGLPAPWLCVLAGRADRVRGHEVTPPLPPVHPPAPARGGRASGVEAAPAELTSGGTERALLEPSGAD